MEKHFNDQSTECSASSDSKDCQRVDQYGFERSEDFSYESYEDQMSKHLAVVTRRSKKWSKLLQRTVKLEKNVKVKRYVRKGVPFENRTQIWMAASGAQDQLERNPGCYHSILKAEHDPNIEEVIHANMQRTFPDNIQFPLFNVLLAYGHHNKDVGYCQGMNFIDGYLLIITKDEEKSFWLMDALLGKILPDYYTPTMLGLKMDQEVLGELVRMKIPAVWQVMNRHDVMWTLVVSRWFICLYVDILPVETVLRIWDCLFYEGSKILYRNLISQAQGLPEICEHFKQITHGEYVEDCHTFMQKIFMEPGGLSTATITKLRKMCRNRISSAQNPPSH
uniref:Growth hormone-regulated TBC protein 1 n=1 Tax=Cyprinus carpio carpio TaxID=630221 RepID=A0A8C1B0S8_CYPCA